MLPGRRREDNFGTGAFLLTNAGNSPVPSKHGLLSTALYDFGGQKTYALEGAVACCAVGTELVPRLPRHGGNGAGVVRSSFVRRVDGRCLFRVRFFWFERTERAEMNASGTWSD